MGISAIKVNINSEALRLLAYPLMGLTKIEIGVVKRAKRPAAMKAIV